MLRQRGQVFDPAVFSLTVDFPDADAVVSSSCGQSPLPVWLEVSRVDRGILLMPIDDEGGRLHGGGASADVGMG